jgi:hypothetical protein
MQVLKNFFSSEKAVFAFLVFLVGSALVIMGRMTVPQYEEFVLWVLGIYTGGKALQGGLAAIGSGTSAATATNSTLQEIAKVLSSMEQKPIPAEPVVVPPQPAPAAHAAPAVVESAPVVEPAAPAPSTTADTKPEPKPEKKSKKG